MFFMSTSSLALLQGSCDAPPPPTRARLSTVTRPLPPPRPRRSGACTRRMHGAERRLLSKSRRSPHRLHDLGQRPRSRRATWVDQPSGAAVAVPRDGELLCTAGPVVSAGVLRPPRVWAIGAPPR